MLPFKQNEPSSQLSLAEYRSLISNLPAPTALQVKAFADYVAEAHSWYKHLPVIPPGLPLQLYIDPSAGLQRVITEDGLVRVEVRTERGFHYSWLKTTDYRERFAHLAFSRSAGTVVASRSKRGGMMVGSDDAPEVYNPKTSTLHQLPTEVLVAGRVMITGVVHSAVMQESLWRFVFKDYKTLSWPEQSGGMQVLDELRAVVEELAEHPERRQKLNPEVPLVDRYYYNITDARIIKLLAPELKRQRGLMVSTIERLCELIYT